MRNAPVSIEGASEGPAVQLCERYAIYSHTVFGACVYIPESESGAGIFAIFQRQLAGAEEVLRRKIPGGSVKFDDAAAQLAYSENLAEFRQLQCPAVPRFNARIAEIRDRP